MSETRTYTMPAGKLTGIATVEYVPCPPEHAAAWWAGRKLLWQMILEAYARVQAEKKKNDSIKDPIVLS